MEEEVKRNKINLTSFHYDKKIEGGLTLHEAGQLWLTTYDNSMFNKLISFCEENNIQMDVCVDRRIIYNGSEKVIDSSPYETIPLKDFLNKFNIK